MKEKVLKMREKLKPFKRFIIGLIVLTILFDGTKLKIAVGALIVYFILCKIAKRFRKKMKPRGKTYKVTLMPKADKLLKYTRLLKFNKGGIGNAISKIIR